MVSSYDGGRSLELHMSDFVPGTKFETATLRDIVPHGRGTIAALHRAHFIRLRLWHPDGGSFRVLKDAQNNIDPPARRLPYRDPKWY